MTRVVRSFVQARSSTRHTNVEEASFFWSDSNAVEGGLARGVELVSSVCSSFSTIRVAGPSIRATGTTLLHATAGLADDDGVGARVAGNDSLIRRAQIDGASRQRLRRRRCRGLARAHERRRAPLRCHFPRHRLVLAQNTALSDGGNALALSIGVFMIAALVFAGL